MQRNQDILKSLIGACLHLSADQIQTVEVLNPIMLGKQVGDKEYLLDLKVLMNSSVSLDMEMQVVDYHDWPERSLQYLCRLFDDLNRGAGYKETKSAIHIGILDYEVFPGKCTLRDAYCLMNEKTYAPYTDKFWIYQICLKKAEEATEEDRLFKTDLWARFFKTTSWEDLIMLARKDMVIASAVETVNQLWADREIRYQIEAREDRIKREKAREEQLRLADETIANQKKEINDQREEINNQKEELKMQRELLANKDEEIAALRKELERIELERSRNV